jgi:hypothetical protein
MVRKRTPTQQLVDLYKKVIKENLQNQYVVHCTDGKRVREASQRALDEEYRNALKMFTTTLDEVIDPLKEEIEEQENRIEELRWDVMQAGMGDDF